MRVKTSFLLLVLESSLIACSQTPIASVSTATLTPTVTTTIRPTPTPGVGGIETALAAYTPPSPNPSRLPTLSFPPTMEPPADFSPVLYGRQLDQLTTFLLLGGVGRETWLAPDISVARFPSAGTYSLHTFTQEAKYFIAGSAPAFSPTCNGYIVGASTTTEESASFVGTLDGWAVTKRPVSELLDEEGFYRKQVVEWLRGEGISAPEVDSLRIYRVDIEGDGTDEVFISAIHLDDSQHTTRAGDYSIVLLRQVVGNEVVTKLVVGDVYRSQEQEITFPRTYSFANFIDLNQDGRLEVVVDVQKWEGIGARVYQIDGDDIIQTLSAEC